MDTNEIIDKVNSLPIERKTFIIDSLLKSLHTIDKSVEDKWLKLANERLEEIRSGKAKTIPGEEVFKKIWKKYSV